MQPSPPSRHMARWSALPVRDRIELRGLRFVGCHGVLPEEHLRAQPFEVDVDLFADLRPPGLSDDLSQTVDYGSLCEAVRSVVEEGHVDLLERLAEDVAASVLASAGEHALAVAVAIRKIRPPLPYDLGSVGVRIFREARSVGVAAGADGRDGLGSLG